ncbi:uncharacterized protein DNG_09075 [Cephalotrichum gorgonifer]|uniref:Uncharacterized protein n=1 Tax=Cephalotrichum gorgonifer TaxID=2041049 RepID=A0AAE8N4Z6_9PEZI|nr:uncharacterized protein DNG_09075 [Cephalotrichum gorgonifer]
MASPIASLPHEFARVVWASHILSYLNPYTETRSDKHPQATISPSVHQNVDSDEDDDLDDDADIETASQIMELLTPYDTNVREKFLNCVAELLSHSKGGATVTAAALREKEDSVEVDLSRNAGFGALDERYLSLLAGFLASADIVDSAADQVETKEGFRSFLETTIDLNANRLDFWFQKAKDLIGS